MKEATGELNMTVVTIVAIAALLAFFYFLIWPNLKIGMALSSACSAANGAYYKTTADDDSWTITCDDAGGDPSAQTCDYESNGKKSSRKCTANKNV